MITYMIYGNMISVWRSYLRIPDMLCNIVLTGELRKAEGGILNVRQWVI